MCELLMSNKYNFYIEFASHIPYKKFIEKKQGR